MGIDYGDEWFGTQGLHRIEKYIKMKSPWKVIEKILGPWKVLKFQVIQFLCLFNFLLYKISNLNMKFMNKIR